MRCCSTLTICLAGVVVWATIEAGISLAEAQSQDCTVELCPPLPPPLPLLQPPGAAATGGLAAVRATEVSLAAVQAQNQNIRDAIQRRASTGATGRPVVVAEPAEDPTDWPWQALAYRTRDAKSPITKAPAMPTAPSYQFATWGQLFGDRETRSGNINGIDIGRRTNTGGGLGGAYLTAPGVSSGDVWVIGLLGGGTAADTRNNDGTTARVDGPGFGAHMLFIRGGFSTDAIFKADRFTLNTSTPDFTGLRLSNYAVAANVNYKSEFVGWWIEPTVGTIVTNTFWDASGLNLGLTNGHQVRVQGGARIGSAADWNGVRVGWVVGLSAYSDVVVSGGVLAVVVGNLLVPTDQNKIFGQATAKLNFDWGRGLSSYVEGEVRGRDNALGVAARLGVTYAFH